jgi:lipopolysaccharide biosynthesis regulator YciM
LFKCRDEIAESLSSLGLLTFGHLFRQRGDKTQAVLKVALLCLADKPVTIHIRILYEQPWKGLKEAGFKLCLRQAFK